MKSEEMALHAAKILSKKNAADIILINIGEKSAFADYFIIASGGNPRQLSALRDEVEDKFENMGVSVKHVKGKKNSGWILMDYGDIVVNLMTDEMREKYNIEKLWGDCDAEAFENI